MGKTQVSAQSDFHVPQPHTSSSMHASMPNEAVELLIAQRNINYFLRACRNLLCSCSL